MEFIQEDAASNDISNGETAVHIAVGKKLKKEKAKLDWALKNFPEATIVIIHVHWHSKRVLTDFGCKFQYDSANEQSQAQHREVERRKMNKLMDDYKNFCSQREVKAHHTEHEDVLEGIQCLVAENQIKRLVVGSKSMAKQVSLLRHCQIWHVRKGKLVSTSKAISEQTDTRALQKRCSEVEVLAPHIVDNSRAQANETLAFVTPPNELEDMDDTDQENVVMDDNNEGESMWQEAPLDSLQNSERNTGSISMEEVVELRKLLTEATERLRQTEQEVVTLQRKMSRMRSFHEPVTPSHIRQYTEVQLKKATNNFCAGRLIGEGGYGPVYKANLLGDMVAIKMLSPDSIQSSKEYEQELKVLSKVDHPNIVKLIGVCWEVCALVYEYLPHNNLNQRLDRGLRWQDRIRIIGEQRSALIYLHTSAERGRAIVHADLKFSNILLDENDVSRLSDFGTARLMHQSSSTIYRITNPMGTSGYIDPAFLMTGELTPQSDIYSFGIIILRLLTGLPESNIKKKVEEAMKKKSVRRVLDASAGEWPVTNTKQLLQLAVRCCNINPRKRPGLESSEWRTLDILQEMASNSIGNSLPNDVLKRHLCIFCKSSI